MEIGAEVHGINLMFHHETDGTLDWYSCDLRGSRLDLTRLVCSGDVLLVLSRDIRVAHIVRWIIDNNIHSSVQMENLQDAP